MWCQSVDTNEETAKLTREIIDCQRHSYLLYLYNLIEICYYNQPKYNPTVGSFHVKSNNAIKHVITNLYDFILQVDIHQVKVYSDFNKIFSAHLPC